MKIAIVVFLDDGARIRIEAATVRAALAEANYRFGPENIQGYQEAERQGAGGGDDRR